MAIGLTMAEGIVLLVTEVLSLIQTIYVLHKLNHSKMSVSYIN